jgi:phage tail protein X
MPIKYRCSDGDMLDEICHRHYGRSAGTVEAVLKANPGLADKGEIYTVGTVILLPELTASTEQKTVKLWD